MSDYRTFVVPYDFSEHAEAALATASDLARRLDARLHLVHVVQPPAYAYGYGLAGVAAAPPPIDLGEVEQGALESLSRVISDLGEAAERAEPHVVQGSDIAEMIRQVAGKLDADLIVMGTHGRTGLAHVFLGSVMERTVRRAACPVLAVQAPAGA
jgi:nucleotide-binding universal stress UspA family protein